MERGYGNREPGRYTMKGGVLLIVGNTGESAWYARIRVGKKDTLKRLATANQKCNHRQAVALALEEKEKARAEAKAESAVPNTSKGEIGTYFKKWADTNLSSGSWSERHHAKTLERAEKYLGELWTRDIHSLTRLEIVEQLEAGDSRDSAGRCFSWCAEMFEDLIDSGVLTDNPLGRKPKSLRVKKGKRHASYGLDTNKVSDLYRKIGNADAAASVRLCSQTIMLTGLRNTEARMLLIPYVDFRKKQIVVPRELMKEKDEWRGDFVIPMSPQLEALMRHCVDRAKDMGTMFLFSGFKRLDAPVTAEAVEKLFKRLTDSKHKPHGTRTSLFSWSTEVREDAPHIARTLLDHASMVGSDAHYNVTSFVKARRPILEAWSELIAG